MSKVKMTVTKLLALRNKRDAFRNNFNAADEKLRKLCTHPRSRMSTVASYRSDTLGNNSYESFHDECGICGKWSETYYENPRYPEKVKKNG